MKFDEILACMVARRNMISVMPSGDGFKPEIDQIWDVVKNTMDAVFGVISQYSQAGLGTMNFIVQDYEVLFYILPDTENALVAVVPALANKGLIDVELERARQKIEKIREKAEAPKEDVQETLVH